MANTWSFSLLMIVVLATSSALIENPWREHANCRAQVDQKRCSCEADCAKYGECCLSSPYFVPEQQIQGASSFTCSIIGFSNIYVIDKCPTTWNNDEIRYLCENSKSDRNNNLLLTSPLTSTSSNITYPNWYCAACNRDIGRESTHIWPSWLNCPCISSLFPNGSVSSEDFNQLIHDTDFISNHLVYNTSTDRWQFKSFDSTEGGDQIECDCYHILWTPEEAILSYCEYGVISKCSETWVDKTVEENCKAYTDRLCIHYDMYRNAHCAICNYKQKPPNDNYYQCRSFSAGVNITPFTIILDWKGANRKNKCKGSDIYDPLAKTCRQVYVD